MAEAVVCQDGIALALEMVDRATLKRKHNSSVSIRVQKEDAYLHPESEFWT